MHGIAIGNDTRQKAGSAAKLVPLTDLLESPTPRIRRADHPTCTKVQAAAAPPTVAARLPARGSSPLGVLSQCADVAHMSMAWRTACRNFSPGVVAVVDVDIDGYLSAFDFISTNTEKLHHGIE